MNPDVQTPMSLEETRGLRHDIDVTLKEINTRVRTRPLSIAVTKLEEAKMWLGKHMGEVGGEDLNKKRDQELLSNK